MTSSTERDNRRSLPAFCLLMAVAIAVFTAGLGLRGPWPPDAPRFALVAEEMVATGQWLVPHRAGEPYSEKPPLFFWAVAAIYALTGSIRLAHLLPSALAGMFVVLLTVDLARRLWGPRQAVFAGCALLLTLQLPMQARSGQIDMVLALWTTLGLYGLMRHLLLGPAWGWYVVASLSMGLGVITKGVGFLPFLALLPFVLLRWRGWRHLPGPFGHRGLWLLGPMALAVPIAAWLVPMWLATSGDPALVAYRNDVLLGQTADRFTDAPGHLRPWWFFIANRMWILWFPLSIAFCWLVPAWWRRFARRDARYGLLLGWVALVLLFFSLSSGKRGVYILPALPAVAVAAAPLLPGLMRTRSLSRVAHLMVLALGGLLTTGFVIGIRTAAPWAEKAAVQYGMSIWWWVALSAIVAFAWALATGPRRGLVAVAGFLVTGWMIYGWLVEPKLDRARSGRGLMMAVAGYLPASAELAMVGWREQLILQADRPVTHFGFDGVYRTDESQLRRARTWLSVRPARWLMLPASHVDSCFDEARLVEVGTAHRYRWYLADVSALRADCRVSGDDSTFDREPIYHSVGPPGR